MKGHTSEEIKYRLSDLGVQIGNIAIEYITKLEKENAELKEKLNIRSCQNCKHNNKSCPNDGSCKHYSKWECRENPQLAKAKEIIREIMKYDIPTLYYEQAEQFIKEIEK